MQNKLFSLVTGRMLIIRNSTKLLVYYELYDTLLIT